MKDYLLRTFRYNEEANLKVLASVLKLSDKSEALKLLSHIIQAQNKWYNRIACEVPDENLAWFGDPYSEDLIETEMKKSFRKWTEYLEEKSESALEEAVRFKRSSDQKTLYLSLMDLALQLNYHSIHHRAQINTLISKQGIKPPLTDYIFTVLKEE